MKKIKILSVFIIAFAVFFLFKNIAKADTEVSGNITADTIWILANSPYIVTDTVQVLQGVKLTIEPGVTIKFSQGTSLIIGGKLIANANESNRIIFTSNLDIPQPGDWDRIRFIHTADPLVVGNNNYISGSILNYCDIQYGGRTLDIDAGMPYISNSNLNNNYQLILYSDLTGVLKNSIVENNNRVDVGRNYLMSNSIARYNREFYGQDSGIIEYSELSDNNLLTLSNSVIIGNHIFGNKTNEGLIRIDIASTSHKIKFNIFEKNGDATNNLVSIVNGNREVNFVFSKNNIINDYNRYFVNNKNGSQFTSGYDFSDNYWGIDDSLVIVEKIYDYYDDISLGKVIYEPFRSAELKFDGTEVSGNITTDTIWTLANSPYIVTDTVQVLQGVKLTIEPGVVIKFNKGTGLNIDGEFIAEGTQDNMIIFTSYDPTQKWGNIEFFQHAVSTKFDENNNYVSGSKIKYTKIENGGSGEDYSEAMIAALYPKLFIANNIIENNEAMAMYIFRGSGSVISNNIIRNNLKSTLGWREVIYSPSGGNFFLSNIIENNGGGCSLRVGGDVNTIKDNIIRNNNNGLSYESKSGIVSGNLIDHNIEIGLNIRGDRDWYSEISSNKISNNSIGVKVVENYSGNYDGSVSLINNNIFENKDYNILLSGHYKDVNAKYNYWGFIDHSTIEAKIYDYYDDISLGKVLYEPFCSSELKFDGTDQCSPDTTPPSPPANPPTTPAPNNQSSGGGGSSGGSNGGGGGGGGGDDGDDESPSAGKTTPQVAGASTLSSDRIKSLYQKIFNRIPQTAELNYWVNVKGYSLNEIKKAFYNSNEYNKKIKNFANKQGKQKGIEKLFQDIFGRPIKKNDLAHWLKQDTSILGIKFLFLNSKEYKTNSEDKQGTERRNQIASLYRNILMRPPDQNGLNYWDKTKKPLKQIRTTMLNSAEFKNSLKTLEKQKGREAAFEQLFEAVFNSPADGKNYKYFVQKNKKIDLQKAKAELIQSKRYQKQNW